MELTGLERLQRGLGSRGQTVPFLEAAPMPVVEVGVGHATCELPPTPWFDGLTSPAASGPLAALADRTLGTAVLTVLPAGLISVSIGLHLDVVTDSDLDVRPLTCAGHGARVGDRRGFARGDLLDRTGSVIARATLHTMVVPASTPSDPDRPTGPGPIGQAAVPAIPADVPLAADLGIRAEVDDGRARLQVPPDERLANSLGMVHGGAIAVVLDLAGTLAIGSGSDPEITTSPLEFGVRYLRPTPLTGPVVCCAEVTYQSRALVVVDHRILDPDGRVTATAQSTHAIVLGMPPASRSDRSPRGRRASS